MRRFTKSASSQSAAGTEAMVIDAGWVVAHPSGTLLVARNDGKQLRLFEVSAEIGTERAIAEGPGTHFQSIGGIRADGLLAASLLAVDSWWLRLGLVDLTSGRTTQLPGDGVSEVLWATWTPNGQILALKLGMNATIWTFTTKDP